MGLLAVSRRKVETTVDRRTRVRHDAAEIHITDRHVGKRTEVSSCIARVEDDLT